MKYKAFLLLYRDPLPVKHRSLYTANQAELQKQTGRRGTVGPLIPQLWAALSSIKGHNKEHRSNQFFIENTGTLFDCIQVALTVKCLKPSLKEYVDILGHVLIGSHAESLMKKVDVTVLSADQTTLKLVTVSLAYQARHSQEVFI